MPKGKEEEEDYQTIMNNTDWTEIYEKEHKLRQKEYIKNYLKKKCQMMLPMAL